MKAVRIAPYYGIVIRQRALEEKHISLASILEEFEGEQPFDSTQELLSFGPCFGPEAAQTLIERLKVAGLDYIDDFFLFSGDFPEWCAFEAKLTKGG